MKNLVLTALLCTLLCSCPESGDVKTYEYSIVNNSSKSAVLFLYKDGNLDLSSKITLQPGQEHRQIHESSPPAYGFSMWALFNSQNTGIVTDVAVIYDNTKKTIYHRCQEGLCMDGSKNIFGHQYNDEQTESFILTPEDYQNAIECVGNCY